MRVSTPTITVRYFAGAAAAAGRDEEPLSAPADSTLADVLTLLSRARPEVAGVLGRCSFLWDGITVRDRAQPLPPRRTDGAADSHAADGAPAHTLDILPPFAGG